MSSANAPKPQPPAPPPPPGRPDVGVAPPAPPALPERANAVIEQSVRRHLGAMQAQAQADPHKAGAGPADWLSLLPVIVQIVQHVYADLHAAGVLAAPSS